MQEAQQPTVFLLENGVAPTSIAFGWSISGDPPKSIKVFRIYPTEQLLVHLTPEQFANITIWNDTDRPSETFHSYLVSYEYDDMERSGLLDTRTIVEISGTWAEVVSCGKICCHWSGNRGTIYRNDGVKPPLGTHSTGRTVCGIASDHWTDCNNVTYPRKYTYHAAGRDSNTVGPDKSCQSRAVSGFLNLRYAIIDETGEPVLDPDHGTYELLVPQNNAARHYSRIPGENNWQFVDTLTLPQGDHVRDTALSLIQNVHHPELLEALAQVVSAQGNDYLAAYEFKWAVGQSESFKLATEFGPLEKITGAPALIQSDQGYFEVFVPYSSVISHISYQQDMLRDARGRLVNVLRLPDAGMQAASLAVTQSTTGKIIVIARVTSFQQGNGDILFAFELDPAFPWTPFTPVRPMPLPASGIPIDNVTGDPSLLFRTELNAFDLLVPHSYDGREQIDYYVLENDTIQDGVWKFVATLQPQDDTRPVAVSFVRSFTPGNLEAVARVSPPQGDDYLIRYTFNSATGWGPPSVVTSDGKPVSVGDTSDKPPVIG